MPNRVLREGIRTSERINALPHETRWLYVMLLTVADDFGRWHADPRLVSGTCLPFDGHRSDKVQSMLDALSAAGAIHVYVGDGRMYLQIQQWKQRTRADKSKFPEPQGLTEIDGHMSVICQSNDGQVTALDVDVDVDVDGDDLTVQRRCTSSRFADAWTDYPDKTGKARAEAAYKKALREGTTHDEVVAGLRRYLAYVAARRANGFAGLKYKNGGTWFHQRGWLDEYEIKEDTTNAMPIFE